MSQVKINTARMEDYVYRINYVRNRLKNVKQKLERLFAKEGLFDFSNQISGDFDNGVYALKKVTAYLKETQDSYEKLDKDLKRMIDDPDPFEWHRPLLFREWFDFSKDYKPFPKAVAEKKDFILPFYMSSEKADKKGFIEKFFDAYENVDDMKEYIDGFTDEGVEWSDSVKDSMKYIKFLDGTNSFISGAYKYLKGFGDTEWMTEGFNDALDSIENFVDFATTDSASWDPASTVLISYGKNLVSNWMEKIQTETEISEIYWHTFANSALETFDDVVCNDVTLALAYKPAQMITDMVGYDLQGEYERATGKKGFEAVTSGVSELGEIIVENSSWENWKSGMKIMCDGIADFFGF